MQKKNLIKAPNIGEIRSFPKEQEVAIFKNFAREPVRQNGQQSPIFEVELQKTCNVRIPSWIMILIAFNELNSLASIMSNVSTLQ